LKRCWALLQLDFEQLPEFGHRITSPVRPWISLNEMKD
jgi:hypothetical protein